MKRWYRVLLILLLAMTIGSVGWIAQPTVPRWSDARKIAVPGFSFRDHFREDGSQKKYVVFFPHVGPPNGLDKYPVLLFLNGFGENGDDGFRHISNNFGRQIWECQETFPFVAVALQCSRGGSWSEDGPDVETGMAILDQVIADYPVDPDRVYLTGVSSGGAGVFHVGSRYPDRFAAIVPISATSSGGDGSVGDDSEGDDSVGDDPVSVATTLAEYRVPVWLFYNGRDLVPVVESNRSISNVLYERGCDYRATEYDRLGHSAWDFALRDPAMYAWLLQHSRSGQSARSSFHPVAAPDSLSESPSGNEEARLHWIGPIEGPFELLLEAKFEQPLQLGIRSDDNVDSDRHDYLLGPAGRPFESETQGRKSVVAGNFFAQASIRPRDWNHVEITRSGGKVTVTANGWELYSEPDPLGDLSSCQVGLRYRSSGTLEPIIQSVRYRQLPPSDDRPEPLARRVSQATMAQAAAKPAVSQQSVVDLLRRRAASASAQRILWRLDRALAGSEFTPHGYHYQISGRPSLEVFEEGVNYRSARRCDRPPGREQLDTDPRSCSGTQFRQAFLDSGDPFQYSHALAERFRSIKASAGPWQPFQRMVSDDRWIDTWHGVDDAFPRVIHRNALGESPISWARLTHERGLHDQIDSLHAQAALLALGALGQPTLAVDWDNLELLPQTEIVDGQRCVCLRERREGTLRERRFWVDVAGGGVVRRFQGRSTDPDDLYELEYFRPMPVLLGDTHISIEYRPGETQPAAWSVISRQSEQSPLNALSRAMVTAVEEIKEQPIDFSAWEALAGAWVVDQVRGTQYIHWVGGRQREITPQEVRLQPQYDELIATDSGQVTASSTIPWWLQRARIWLAVLGCVMILGAWYGRRKVTSAAADSQAEASAA